MEQYDNQGRMKYNPEYHHNQGKPWSIDDLIYLCSMHGGMERKSLSMALGRTEATIMSKLHHLKKQGEYRNFRNLGKAI